MPRASRCVRINLSSLYYQPKERSDSEIINLLTTLPYQHLGYDFDKLFKKTRTTGHRWNHKRIYRFYCEMTLNLRRKHKKRYPPIESKPLLQPIMPNPCWSMDFMSDALNGGRKFRTFNVVDDYNREVPTIESGPSLTSERIIRTLEQLIEVRGVPEQIRMDLGPEFTSHQFKEWCEKWDIEMAFTQLGKLTQNAFISRFNVTYRRVVEDSWCSSTLNDGSQKTERWIKEYNTEGLH